MLAALVCVTPTPAHAEDLQVGLADAQADAAAAIDCAGSNVSIVMTFAGPEIVPEQRPDLTPAGNPTLKKPSKTGANELYFSAMASNVLATVKEAFAVAPALQEATVLVVRNVRDGAGGAGLSAIYAGRFDRDTYRHPWARDPDIQVEDATDALFSRKGRTKELAALDLSDEPELKSVVQQVAAGLHGANS